MDRNGNNMKTFSFILRDALKNGLRPDADVARNSPFWEQVKNIKPSPQGGAIKNETITNPVVTPATAVSWPFPQLIRGEDITLLPFAQNIYSLNESTWAGTDLSITPGFFEAGDPPQAETIDAGGGVWQPVFFQDQWYMTNGQQLVFQTPREADSKILVTTSSVLNAQAIAKDTALERMLFGGLSGTYFDGSEWTNAIFALWRLHREVAGSWQETDTALSTNWIFWGPPGGGSYDLPEALVQGALGLLVAAQYSEVKEMVYEAIDAGTIGMCPLRTQGAIRAIRELSEGPIVYDDDSVTVLRRDGTEYVPVKIHEIGIAGRGAVAGTMGEHVFVDSQSVLCRVTSDGVERIGFSEYLDDLTLSDIVVTRDPDRNEYYISDGVKGYGYAYGQLSETTRVNTGLSRVPTSGLIGISEDLGVETDFEFKGLPFNMDRPGMKTVKQVDFSSVDVEALECRLHYNYKDSSEFSATRWFPANNEGVAFPFATAMNFKLEVRGRVTQTNPRIENIRVWFQAPDRRYVRGGIGTPAER